MLDIAPTSSAIGSPSTFTCKVVVSVPKIAEGSRELTLDKSSSALIEIEDGEPFSPTAKLMKSSSPFVTVKEEDDVELFPL